MIVSIKHAEDYRVVKSVDIKSAGHNRALHLLPLSSGLTHNTGVLLSLSPTSQPHHSSPSTTPPRFIYNSSFCCKKWTSVTGSCKYKLLYDPVREGRSNPLLASPLSQPMAGWGLKRLPVFSISDWYPRLRCPVPDSVRGVSLADQPCPDQQHQSTSSDTQHPQSPVWDCPVPSTRHSWYVTRQGPVKIITSLSWIVSF